VAEQIALLTYASQAQQYIALCLGLDALGDDGDIQALSQRKDCANNRNVVRVDEQVTNEGLVDFQLVQRQTL